MIPVVSLEWGWVWGLVGLGGALAVARLFVRWV